MTTMSQTGGELVCAALAGAGIGTIFSVSGNQILPVYDAALDADVRILHNRHESASAYAAAAYADLTGEVGVVLTSAGPGFLAALQGIAAAKTMELPILFFSGDSPVSQRGKGAFQEMNQPQIASAVCKTSFRIDRPADIPAAIIEAIDEATSGVPGPVHVSLPGDVLAGRGEATEPPARRPDHPGELTGDEAEVIDQMAQTLTESKRPLIFVRPSLARGEAGRIAVGVARTVGVEPIVIEAPRGLADPKYGGLSSQIAGCDCALVLAPADFAAGFLAEDALAANGKLLVIDAEGDPPSQRTPDLHLRSDPVAALRLLAAALEDAEPATETAWRTHWPLSPPPGPEIAPEDEVHPLAVSDAVRSMIGPDDVIILDGGEFCQWIRLGLRDSTNRLLWNGKIGAIGGAIPMAVGAAVAKPQARIIAIMGDGGSGYHLSEFETLDRYGLPVVAIVGNDARWAAEWHLQIARYGPDRVYETELTTARYDQVAAGFNVVPEHIRDGSDLPAALQEALGRQRSTCINVAVAALPSPAAMS